MDASAAVPQDYFALPIADAEGAIYRERVYCDELYHQWRCLWNTAEWTLCGEIDKQGHPIIRSRAKPDFLVHHPGLMQNLVAVEVKPANASTKKMIKDLRTLTYFRSRLGNGQNYFSAYFLVYGQNENDWPALGRRLVTRAQHDDEVDLALIRPVLHSRFGARAEFVNWPDAVGA